MARVFLTQGARTHFDELPPNLQDPVDNALTEIEADPCSTGKQLLGRLKGIVVMSGRDVSGMISMRDVVALLGTRWPEL